MQQLTCKWFGLFLFILFYSLKKRLNFKKSPGGKKCEKVWKSVKSVYKRRNDFALSLLPFSFSLKIVEDRGSHGDIYQGN